MRAFGDHNPIAVAVYFAAVAGVAVFCMHPALLLCSFLGALLLCLLQKGGKRGGFFLFLFVLFLVTALINPIVSHNGVTVLFVVNNAPITLEAACYGVIAALMIATVLLWFRSFTDMMTSDKLLYLLGGFSPKLALILSMGLRYVPLFARQAKRVNQAQKGLGLYQEDTLIDRARGGLRIFSVMVTWALENGIITADSMTARGYGTGKRTHFSVFSFGAFDVALLLLTFLLAGVTITAFGLDALEFNCYPAIRYGKFTFLSAAGMVAYGLLCLLPALFEGKERIKWKYLKSKM